jgi:hypothetical protein
MAANEGEPAVLPFYPPKDVFLKPVYKIQIVVHLSKMRPLNQSVSNWEIRERLKKMLKPVEVGGFLSINLEFCLTKLKK